MARDAGRSWQDDCGGETSTCAHAVLQSCVDVRWLESWRFCVEMLWEYHSLSYSELEINVFLKFFVFFVSVKSICNLFNILYNKIHRCSPHPYSVTAAPSFSLVPLFVYIRKYTYITSNSYIHQQTHTHADITTPHIYVDSYFNLHVLIFFKNT